MHLPMYMGDNGRMFGEHRLIDQRVALPKHGVPAVNTTHCAMSLVAR